MIRNIILSVPLVMIAAACTRLDVVGSQDSGSNSDSAVTPDQSCSQNLCDAHVADVSATDASIPDTSAADTSAPDVNNADANGTDARHSDGGLNDSIVGTWRTAQQVGPTAPNPVGYHTDLVFNRDGTFETIQSGTFDNHASQFAGCAQNRRGYGSWTLNNSNGQISLDETGYHETIERTECIDSTGDIVETASGPVPPSSSSPITFDGTLLVFPGVTTSTNSFLTFRPVLASAHDSLVGTWTNNTPQPANNQLVGPLGYHTDLTFSTDGSVAGESVGMYADDGTSEGGCTAVLSWTTVWTVQSVNGVDSVTGNAPQQTMTRTGCTNPADNLAPTTIPNDGGTSGGIFVIIGNAVTFPAAAITYTRQ